MNLKKLIKELAWLVAAIVTIAGAIYAAYQNRHLVGFTSSNIEIRPLASTKAYMLFLAENSGNKPGSIGRVTGQFHFIGSSGRQYWTAPLRLDVVEYVDGQIIISPSSPAKLRVHFANEARLANLLKGLAQVGEVERTDCKVEFEVSNYDGSTANEAVAFDCRQHVAEYFRMRNKATLTIPF